MAQNCVVRNSLIGGKWGAEENNGGLPFQKGANFDLNIKIDQDAYRVDINKKPFCEFRHRADFKNLKSYELSGEIKVTEIKESPPKQLAKSVLLI